MGKTRYGIIYKIRNKINNKVYIGLTSRNFNKRYSAEGEGIERVYNYHRYQRKNNQYSNLSLMGDIKKYGFNSFDVDKCFDVAYGKQELLDKEKYWVKYFNAFKHGYNHTEGGDTFLKGEDNPKYNSVVFNCEICGREVVREQAKCDRAKNNYCSVECAGIGQSKHYSGKDSPLYNRVNIKCDCCGKSILRTPSIIGEYNYCSKKCHIKSQGYSMLGKNNPNYGNTGKVSGANNGRARKVVCKTTNEVFECIKDGADKYGANNSCIVECCKGNQKTAGKHPKTGKRLVWQYYEDYIE